MPRNFEHDIHPYDAVIFDVDGTLWNATAASAEGWNRGLEALELAHLRVSAREVSSVLGLVTRECIASLFPEIAPASLDEVCTVLDRHEAETVVEQGGLLYPGAAEALPALGEAAPLFIVSNCQAWYLEAFLAHSGLRALFSDSVCHGSSGLPKAENIALMASRNGLERAVYVGDTATDQQAAGEAGVVFIHAAWGFGRAAAPCPAFVSFAELAAHLLTGT